MKKKMLWIIAIAAVILLFVGAYFLYNSLSKDYSPNIPTVESSAEDNDASEEPQDYSAPDFTVTDAEGNEVKLSDFIGKPVVLNFWASWCPPCKSEMPHFEAAYKDHEDIQFMMVNTTSGDTKSDAEKLIEEEGYTFPVFYDITGNAANTYGTSSLPMTFFIDKEGNLVTYAVGMLSAENLETGIEMISGASSQN